MECDSLGMGSRIESKWEKNRRKRKIGRGREEEGAWAAAAARRGSTLWESSNGKRAKGTEIEW